MKMQVVVRGENVEIDVDQRAKTVWIASGEYKGKYYDAQRPTPGAAAKGWVNNATYHSN